MYKVKISPKIDAFDVFISQVCMTSKSLKEYQTEENIEQLIKKSHNSYRERVLSDVFARQCRVLVNTKKHVHYFSYLFTGRNPSCDIEGPHNQSFPSCLIFYNKKIALVSHNLYEYEFDTFFKIFYDKPIEIEFTYV